MAHCILPIGLSMLLHASLAAQAGERPFTPDAIDPGPEAEARAWRAFSENLMLDVDLIARGGYGDRRGKTSGLLAAGIDLHDIVTLDSTDLGSLLLQGYLVRRDNAQRIPNHVDDDDAWDLELHQAWFNLTGPGQGYASLRVGHMKYPFGLEPNVDTHFRLRQLITARNLGAKMDWGVSLNGTPPGLDYEIALLRGSGMAYIDKGDNHAAAARIGSPWDRNLSVGLSAFYGETIDRGGTRRYRRGGGGRAAANDVVRRLRLGADAAWIWQRFTLRGELAVGEDFEQEVVHGLLDIEWVTRREDVRLYVQGRLHEQRAPGGWDRDLAVRAGLEWEISEPWSTALEYSGDVERYLGAPRDDVLFIQLRLRL